MAVSTLSTFSDAIQGVPVVGGEIDIYEVNTLPKFAIGHRVTRSDGAVFVYSHFGAAVSAGALVATDMDEIGVPDTDNNIVHSGTALAVAGMTIKPGNAGSPYVEITRASVTKDLYAGGSVFCFFKCISRYGGF